MLEMDTGAVGFLCAAIGVVDCEALRYVFSKGMFGYLFKLNRPIVPFIIFLCK